MHQEVSRIMCDRDTFIHRVSECCGFVIPSIIFLLSGLWSPWQLAKQHAPSPDAIIPPANSGSTPESSLLSQTSFWHHGIFPKEADQCDTPVVEHPPQLVQWNSFYACSLRLNHVKYKGRLMASSRCPLLQHLPRLVLLPPMKKTPPQRCLSVCL